MAQHTPGHAGPLEPWQLMDRLGGMNTLLGDGLRDLASRQRTLRNAIDWSYALLSPDEQRVFRRPGPAARRAGVYLGAPQPDPARAEAIRWRSSALAQAGGSPPMAILFDEWLAERRRTARIEWYWGNTTQVAGV